jgi:hypothetical protein
VTLFSRPARNTLGRDGRVSDAEALAKALREACQHARLDVLLAQT